MTGAAGHPRVHLALAHRPHRLAALPRPCTDADEEPGQVLRATRDTRTVAQGQQNRLEHEKVTAIYFFENAYVSRFGTHAGEGGI